MFDLVVLGVSLYDDIKEFIKAYEDLKTKGKTWHDHVDGHKVLSSFIIGASITSKVNFIKIFLGSYLE